MAQPNPPLLERDALASLNQLRAYDFRGRPGVGPAPLEPASCGRLPVNLGEALDAFNADTALRQALGEEFCQAYENLRRRQWQRERGDISDTERRACLDC